MSIARATNLILLRAVFGHLGRWTSRGKLWMCASVGRDVRVLGRVWVHGHGAVHLGNRVVLDGRACPIELHTIGQGEIWIADDAYIEAGTSIESREKVSIGERVHLGCYCKILDNNFHRARGDRHMRPESKPVVIEADADVGPMNVLLPGAYLEQGVVLGPGKVTGRRIAQPRKAKGQCEA